MNFDAVRKTLALLPLILPAALAAETVLVQGPSGGAGGGGFSDFQPGGRIIEIRVRSGAYIDGIGLVYRVGDKIVAGQWHGGQGGKYASFKLQAGEDIVSIGGRTGRFVDSLWIRTSKNRYKKWGGTGGSRSYLYRAPAGGRLSGFWGRSGVYIDAIGPAFSLRSSSVAVGSLDTFAPVAPSGAPGDGKSDTVQDSGFPQPFYPAGSSQWLGELSASLGGVIRQLAGSQTAFQRFGQKESAACGQDLYCMIWYRQGAIAHVVGGTL